jgi:hypothetical protein
MMMISIVTEKEDGRVETQRDEEIDVASDVGIASMVVDEAASMVAIVILVGKNEVIERTSIHRRTWTVAWVIPAIQIIVIAPATQIIVIVDRSGMIIVIAIKKMEHQELLTIVISMAVIMATLPIKPLALVVTPTVTVIITVIVRIVTAATPTANPVIQAAVPILNNKVLVANNCPTPISNQWILGISLQN